MEYVKRRREDIVDNVISFEEAKQKREQSQRQWASENDVPRTTLQYWLKNKKSINASSALIGFFESSD